MRHQFGNAPNHLHEKWRAFRTANLFVSNSASDLFPFVMLSEPGNKIEANFGPNFKFNIRSDQTDFMAFYDI
uniref:Uncharacterized protein n=1 Tax=Globodera rostochiensis TaxID=31243 RepID=A0A914H4W5_GLORO